MNYIEIKIASFILGRLKTGIIGLSVLRTGPNGRCFIRTTKRETFFGGDRGIQTPLFLTGNAFVGRPGVLPEGVT